MTKNSEKMSEKVKQENLLMFTGAAVMAAGPVFWFLAQTVLNMQKALNVDTYNALGFVDVTLALFMTVTGAALALAGWGLSAWHAWQDVKIVGQ